MEREVIFRENISTIKSTLSLGEKLGEGGFGSVRKCIEESTKKAYAIKTCMKNSRGIPNPMELSIMATIRHPHINRALNIRVDKSSVHIIQELADSDLSKIVRKSKRAPDFKLDPIKVRKWLYSIVSAISCFHENKIVHADLKSSNILVYGDEIRVSDFSVITKLVPGKKPTHLVGTATHRPIENHLRREWDEKLDIWSLGCTFYEILYGESLFSSQSNFGDNKEHITDRFINCLIDWGENGPIKQTYNAIPTKMSFNKFKLSDDFKKDSFGLNSLILKMLSLKPENRPSISEIISHPYFSNLKLADCTFLETEYTKIPKEHLVKIVNLCNLMELPKEIIQITVDLYARTWKMDKGEGRVKSCILLSLKLLRREIPKGLELTPKIFAIENNICTYLGFKLHHRGNIKN